MNDLAKSAMDAHGGLERWRQLKTVTSRLVQGGVLWGLKGKDGILNDVHVTADLRKEWASHWPFTQKWPPNWPFRKPNRYTSFQPDRVALETTDGGIVEVLLNPRDSFKGHVFDTQWDDLQLAYFAGYAIWTYLNTPFLFAFPGVVTEEIQPWQESGATWRRLKVTFPTSIATHSAEQVFYFDQQCLLKRHDYEVDVMGGTSAAHYVSDLEEFSGILVPTKHRIFGRQPDGKAVPDPIVVSIELSEVEFS
jgi:hypothetical protein